jgi:hypothetical protein
VGCACGAACGGDNVCDRRLPNSTCEYIVEGEVVVLSEAIELLLIFWVAALWFYLLAILRLKAWSRAIIGRLLASAKWRYVYNGGGQEKIGIVAGVVVRPSFGITNNGVYLA